MSQTVKKKCVKCGKEFSTSKFTPYVVNCSICKVIKGKPGYIGRKKALKKEKQEKKIEIKKGPANLPGAVYIPQVQKQILPVVNKEEIYMHLLKVGYKLSAANTPYKDYDGVRVIGTLGKDGPSVKLTVSFKNRQTDPPYGIIIMNKVDIKKLPKDAIADITPVVDYIFPKEKEGNATT